MATTWTVTRIPEAAVISKLRSDLADLMPLVEKGAYVDMDKNYFYMSLHSNGSNFKLPVSAQAFAEMLNVTSSLTMDGWWVVIVALYIAKINLQDNIHVTTDEEGSHEFWTATCADFIEVSFEDQGYLGQIELVNNTLEVLA